MRARALALELAPPAVFLVAVWTKLSYFNLPTLQYLGWGDWRFREAGLAALASFATLLILFAPLLLLSPLRRFVALWLIDLAATLLIVSNLLYLRFFGDVISVSSLAAGWQVGTVHRSVVELLQRSDGVFFADLVGGLLLLPWYVRSLHVTPRLERHLLRVYAVRMLGAGALLALLPVAAVATAGASRNENFQIYGVWKTGLLNHYLYEGGRRLYHDVLARRGVGPKERARVRAFLERRRNRAATCGELKGVARNKNLILVMVESLHAFPMGLRIDGQEVAPNLNDLARRSMTFENFYDQTSQGKSSDGEFTSLQSLHPPAAGAVPSSYPNNYYRGLPRILREHGYATLSAHAFTGELWKMREMHARYGFAESLFEKSYVGTERIGMGIADGSFFRQTLPRLAGLPRPFMAFLITLTTHHPYDMPPQYSTLELGDLEGTLLGKYLQTVHYFDVALGELLEGLERSGLLNESVLVLYGDHKAHVTDASFRRPLARLAGIPSPGRGFETRAWQAENRLPLIIHLPGDAAAGVRSVSGGHLDIAPTLLNMLGISDREMVTMGRDLTCGKDSFVVRRDGSFVKGDTLCLTTNASPAAALCRSLKTGETLEPARLGRWFAAARARLEISDLIFEGDLIPRPKPRPLATFLVVGHRGNSSLAPENTLESIEQAFAVGAQMVEVDVGLTRDGVPVLMHDTTLDRTTDGTGPLAEMSLDQVRELDAGSWKGAPYAGEPVPTLAEALQAARGKGRLLLDPKADGMGRAIAEVLSGLKLPRDSVVLGTWNDSQVRDFAETLRGAEILLTGAAPRAWGQGYFQEQRNRGITGFEIEKDMVSGEFIAAAHAHGMPVYAYTINDEPTMRALVELGIDAIETDVPAVLRNLVDDLEREP